MAQIDKPNLHFNTLLYTGTGSSNSVTGVGFQPDLVWIKDRGNTYSQTLTDKVRGTSKELYSNNSNAETVYSQGVTSFDSNGFTLGTDNGINSSGGNKVSWNWKAGNSAGSSNSDGSITSTVSANTTAGFSIVSYAGTGSNATIGHGLGVAPKMIIIKNRSQSNGWITGHEKLDTTNPWHKYVEMNSTNAVADLNTIWNDTAPTSTVFSVGTEAAVNNNGNNFIAYCFAEKKGYSKFGTWTGNGNADGPFIYTGFKPAFLLTKRSDAVDNWAIDDNTRSSINEMNNTLYANLSNAEYTAGGYGIDFLSNGVKIKNNDGHYNGNANTYIFMAFAENPIVGSNNVAAVAR